MICHDEIAYSAPQAYYSERARRGEKFEAKYREGLVRCDLPPHPTTLASSSATG